MRRGSLVAFLIAYVLKLHKIVFIAAKNWKHMISKSENLSLTKGSTTCFSFYHLKWNASTRYSECGHHPFLFSVRLVDPLFGIQSALYTL